MSVQSACRDRDCNPDCNLAVSIPAKNFLLPRSDCLETAHTGMKSCDSLQASLEQLLRLEIIVQRKRLARRLNSRYGLLQFLYAREMDSQLDFRTSESCFSEFITTVSERTLVSSHIKRFICFACKDCH